MNPDGASLRPNTQNLRKRPSQADLPEGPLEKKMKDENQPPLEVDSQCSTDSYDKNLREEFVKSQQEKENRARREGRRIRRSSVKCCQCDNIGAPDPNGKCSSCRHKVCEICFNFQEAPSPSKEEKFPDPEPGECQDELWKEVREYLVRK